MAEQLRESVQDYYGKKLTSTDSLATNACTLSKMAVPKYIKTALSNVHEEVTKK